MARDRNRLFFFIATTFSFLILHSMLHLFGYDHMTDEDAGWMEQVQREILEEMHILR